MVDFDAALAANSLRFREALSAVPASAPVPSCPDWSAGDLLGHLTQVQNFWATIVEQDLQSQEQVGTVQAPELPSDRDAALVLFDGVSRRLSEALARAGDNTAVWTWSGDHTVGWVRRRQAQEALMHRVDAELAAGLTSLIEAELAEDGIDELLTQFGSEAPDWGVFEPSGPLLEVLCVSSPGGAEAPGAPRLVRSRTGWRVRLGRFRGVDPSGQGHDEPDYEPEPDSHDEVDAVIEGSAADMLLWLWGRSDGAGVVVTGDQSARGALRAAILANTQ